MRGRMDGEGVCGLVGWNTASRAYAAAAAWAVASSTEDLLECLVPSDLLLRTDEAREPAAGSVRLRRAAEPSEPSDSALLFLSSIVRDSLAPAARNTPPSLSCSSLAAI